MVQDKEKPYASLSKVCEKQVGLQDKAQQCVLGVPCCLWVQSRPGIDFSENCSPVVNDITFSVLLLMVLHFGYLAKIVDVETAFLYVDLEEEI